MKGTSKSIWRGFALFGAAWSFQLLGESLPAGIGAYRVGSRFITTVTGAYDQHGDLQPLGSRLTNNFDGRSILKGDPNSQLYRLASELDRIADPNQPGKTYADRLDLGQLKGDVQANIQAQFIGLSFGLPQQWNILAGAPWVRARVETTIAMQGTNNAAEIRDELGSLAYDELRQGLSQAALMDTSSIQQAFRDAGYQELGEWRHESIGDFRLGINKEFRPNYVRGGKFRQRWEVLAILPTGYVDDPSILNDVSLGKGYLQLVNQWTASIQSNLGFELGVLGGYSYNLNNLRSVRLPEAEESLVDVSRTIDATLNPGDDSFVGMQISYSQEWWKLGLNGQYSKHFADQYSGSIEGNYAALSRFSETQRFETGILISFSSIAAYSRQRFAVPAILDLAYQRVAGAINETPQNYFELALTSFFDARASKPKSDRKSKTKRSQRLAAR